jgi:hypothetical protein
MESFCLRRRMSLLIGSIHQIPERSLFKIPEIRIKGVILKKDTNKI